MRQSGPSSASICDVNRGGALLFMTKYQGVVTAGRWHILTRFRVLDFALIFPGL